MPVVVMFSVWRTQMVELVSLIFQTGRNASQALMIRDLEVTMPMN